MTEPRVALDPIMPEAEYRAAPGLNYSILKHMDISPAHCRQEIVAPRESTPAMELGSAFHSALLEPGVFYSDYFRAPGVDRRTKAGKAAWADALLANEGKQPLRADDFDWIEGAVEALWSRPHIKALLGSAGSMNEVAAFWGKDGVQCKGLIDHFGRSPDGGSIIVDVKTVPLGGAQKHLFQRDVAKYRYHAQAAWYVDGLNEIAERHRDFLWLVVEKEPPFADAIYQPFPEAIEVGRRKCEDWLRRYVECAENGSWPGYPAEVAMIDLPEWLYKQEGL